MAKLFCAKITCHPYKEVDKTEITEKIFEVDGYQFGDRLLEGVTFYAHFDDKGIIKIEVEDESKGYFSTLNEKHWLKQAKEYAEDILKEGDEVEIPEHLEKKYYKDNSHASWIEP